MELTVERKGFRKSFSAKDRSKCTKTGKRPASAAPPSSDPIWSSARKIHNARGYILLAVYDPQPQITWLKMEHIYIWERHHRHVLPRGHHIHHLDGSRDRNNIDNLVCLPAGAHIMMHAKLNRLERLGLGPDDLLSEQQKILQRYLKKSVSFIDAVEENAKNQLEADMKRKRPNIIDISQVRDMLDLTREQLGNVVSICENGMDKNHIPGTRIYEYETNRRSIPYHFSVTCARLLRDEWANERLNAEPGEVPGIDEKFGKLFHPALGNLLRFMHSIGKTDKLDKNSVMNDLEEIKAEFVRYIDVTLRTDIRSAWVPDIESYYMYDYRQEK